MNEPVVELKDVSRFYGNIMGLNEINLTMGKGMTGLLGPNGAGKSTMLKLITGQIRPSKGIIRVLGRKPWDDPGLNWEMGYCPEQDSFFKGMTGRQFVVFGARMLGYPKSKAERTAEDAISRVDMKRSMNRLISGYSKGMRQRIKIAQSLINDPRLLVLDEPLAGTDPLGRLKIMDLLFDLSKEGVDIIVSSHVLYEIERLTEQIVILKNGKLVAEGNIHEIRDSMDRFPLTVRIRSPDTRKMARRLIKMVDVTSLDLGGDDDELMVRTRDPYRFYEEFQAMMAGSDLSIGSIDSPDDNLDAIFKYLVD
ncbi:MAG: ABC transporter ATP-binding protein [Thermoplasmatota archaeon]